MVTGSAPPTRRRNQRPTLADVATAAQVSVALVSIVMRDAPGASAATRARVRQVADDLGYRPDRQARLLRQRHASLLGVTFELAQAFHGDLVEAVYAAAEPVGYDVVLSAVAPARSETRAVQALLDERCAAVILLGSRAASSALTSLAARLPVVSVARSVRSGAVDCVRTDDRVGMREAVDHLVALGHRRIAYLDGLDAPGARERRRAIDAACAGRRPHCELVVLPAGPTEEHGVSAVRRLLEEAVDATAVIAFNDRCAVGVLDTLLRAGIRVPDHVSVVGFDDSRLSRISYVDLTTVGQDPDRLGRVAVQRAVDRLEDRPAHPRDKIIAPRLVVRGTTGPVRG